MDTLSGSIGGEGNASSPQHKVFTNLHGVVKNMTTVYGELEDFSDKLSELNTDRSEALAKEYGEMHEQLVTDLQECRNRLRNLEHDARNVLLSVESVIRRIIMNEKYIQELQAEIKEGNLDGRLHRYYTSIQTALARCIESSQGYEESYKQARMALDALEIHSSDANNRMQQVELAAHTRKDVDLAAGLGVGVAALATFAATWWFALPLYVAGVAAVLGMGATFGSYKNYEAHSSQVESVQRDIQNLRTFYEGAKSTIKGVGKIDREMHDTLEEIEAIQHEVIDLSDHKTLELDVLTIQQDVTALVKTCDDFQTMLDEEDPLSD